MSLWPPGARALDRRCSWSGLCCEVALLEASLALPLSEPPRTHDHVQQIGHQGERDQTEYRVPQNAHLSSSMLQSSSKTSSNSLSALSRYLSHPEVRPGHGATGGLHLPGQLPEHLR